MSITYSLFNVNEREYEFRTKFCVFSYEKHCENDYGLMFATKKVTKNSCAVLHNVKCYDCKEKHSLNTILNSMKIPYTESADRKCKICILNAKK